MNFKAQAGLEYLMTYGWALAIIVAIAGILFVSIQPVSSELPFNVSDPTKILVTSSTVQGSELKIRLQNATGGKIILGTMLQCGYGACTANNQNPSGLEIPSGGIIEITCPITSEEEASQGAITLVYTDFSNYQRKAKIYSQNSNCPAALRVWSFSDPHFSNVVLAKYNWPGIFEARLNSMNQNYDFGLLLGDIVHTAYRTTEITKADSILEATGAKNKIIALTGNHDTIPVLEGRVKDYYLANMSLGGFNFTRQIGNVLFIIIGDEGCGGPCNYSTYEWFDSLVKENQDKIIVVATHEHPSVVSTWYPISFTSDFEKTLGEADVDLWLYGHTHGFTKTQIFFGERKTLFLGDGHWECSERACAIIDFSVPQYSLLMEFEDESNIVSFKKVIFTKTSLTEPAFEDYGSYVLSKKFSTG